MSNTNNLTDYVLMPGPDYQDMCNAIREKTGITGDIISSQIGNIIRSIQGSVVLPTHTVNFYNDTTLLQSYANVVYGSTVTYTGETPTKAGTDTVSYTFIGFEPSGARITGDTNCYAQFVENVIEPDEPEVTYGWVPMAADGVSYMGETVTVAGAFVVPVLWEFVLSETNQYRATIDGTEYLFSLSEDSYYTDIGEIITLYREGNTIAVNRYMDYPSSTTMALKLESYAAVSAEEEPTIGEWVPFCADGTTWTGEEIDIANTGKGVRPAEYIGAVVISPTNQYRFTLGEDVYEGMNIDEYGEGITLENCPYYLETLNAPTYRFNFISDADLYYTGPLKVESWTGSEPYAPEEEGYVPTDGYQAFTTDGTWTGEEVTTAGATDWSSSDLRWVGDTSTTIEEGMNILVTVNGVQYNCSVTSAGRPKARYVIASDGCPVTIEGGCDFTAYWAVFPTAGTYTLKVEVPTDSQEVDCATFIPFADLTITSGSLLNFQVSWGERPYEEFEGYLDGNADIAAYSYYDGRARGYVVRLINNGDADLTVSSDVTYTIIITNVIVE